MNEKVRSGVKVDYASSEFRTIKTEDIIRQTCSINGDDELVKAGLGNQKATFAAHTYRESANSGGALCRCTVPHNLDLIGFESFESGKYCIELQRYEGSELGLFVAASFGKIGRERLMRVLSANENCIKKYSDDRPNSSISSSWYSAKLHGRCIKDALDYDCEFTIHDDKFGTYFVFPKKKFTGHKLILGVRRPSRDMAMGDIIGISKKYFQ